MRKFVCGMVLLLSLCAGAFASPVKKDEMVVFFPGYGSRIGTDHWELTIRGWIFESERRPGVATSFRKVLGISEGDLSAAEAANFASRTRLFLVDAEHGKRISIRLAGKTFELPPSDATGHFSTKIKVKESELEGRPGRGVVPFSAITGADDVRLFSGTVQLIEPEGISIVSDIDDTIKVSEILDRKKLLHNTFVRDFVPAPGMAELYQGWATNKQVAFHYLSASPSQLFTPLTEFLELNRFPAGTFHLRAFDWRTEFQNHSVPKKHKPAVLDALFSAYPKRRYVLVGDSGEHDPEIYAEVARRFPKNVVRILIRDVTHEASDSPRYKETFSQINSELWRIFQHPSELTAVGLD